MVAAVAHMMLAGLGGGAVSDPNFSSVKILNHFDNNLTDSSSVGFTWTAHGGAAATNAQSKFGGFSLGLSGSAQYLDGTYSTSNHDWYTSDYTLEAWVYVTTFVNASTSNSGAELPAMIGNMDGAGITDYWSFGPDQNSKLSFSYYNGAVQTVVSTGTLSTNTWTHIALTLSGTTIRLFRGGTLDGTASISGTPQSSAATKLTVGQYNSGAAYTGYIDDLRLTKGVARYTSNFTPPTAAFPNS